MDAFEHAARLFEPAPPPRWQTPGQLAQDLDPRTRQTPALTLIDRALAHTYETADARLIISMPPQEGKSQRVSRWFPLWALTHNRDLRVAIASYEANTARRWGRAIRDDITTHGATVGLGVRHDMAAQHEWQLHGSDGGVYTAGVGGALTGRPVDLMVIDDPIKDRVQAESETYRQRTWDWYTDVVEARLAPGAPVVLVLTRWHHDDLAARLTAAGGWTVINIPAQADHDPDAGETDTLGREPGEYMESARGRTEAQWEARQRAAGPRTWASLYQGRPSPQTGGVFPTVWARDPQPVWVERGDSTRWVPGADEVIQSWDLAFKDNATSDYVAWGVWARRGTTVHLVDVGHARLDFNATLARIREVTARWPQAVGKLVEDKANGPAVITALRHEIPGIIPVEPSGSKYARAVAISPFAHAGNIRLPDPLLLPAVVDLTDEAAVFPAGKHDDLVDQMTQAVGQLLLHPILTDTGNLITPDDLLMLDDPHAYLGGY